MKVLSCYWRDPKRKVGSQREWVGSQRVGGVTERVGGAQLQPTVPEVY